jgi:glycolate oxidase
VQEGALKRLREIVGESNVSTDKAQVLNYVFDETPIPLRPEPAEDLVVVKPIATEQVAAVMNLANDCHIPVFPRGGGTGLVAGAIPTKNGIILTMEKMVSVEIDTANLMARAEAGVTLTKLGEAANEAGLSFPSHPGDDNAEVGGLIATNAGGSRAVKHGIMRNQVRELEIVLPNGEILHLGKRVRKNNVGYDLMQLIIGSEGTLAIITKATLQLYPKPVAQLTIIMPYDTPHNAIASVPKILREGITPLAIEYVGLDVVEKTAKHLGAHWPISRGSCCLIVVLDGPSRDELLAQCVAISKTCQENTPHEALVAESPRDQEEILRIRNGIYTALKAETIDILDIAVPISKLELVIDAVDEIAAKYGTRIVIFGHAADGNLHAHLTRTPGMNVDWIESARNDIYQIAITAGGVITGEHGIGKTRLKKLSASLEKGELQLMGEIKQVFDPNGILNPGAKLNMRSKQVF